MLRTLCEYGKVTLGVKIVSVLLRKCSFNIYRSLHFPAAITIAYFGATKASIGSEVKILPAGPVLLPSIRRDRGTPPSTV